MNYVLEDSRSQLSVTQEITLLGVFNEKDRIRHQLVVGIANYPENMTRGAHYPYSRIREESYDYYIEIDSR